MKLDEIEAQIRTLCGAAPTQDGYVRGDVEAACNIALALVAHVRALENVTRMTDDRAFERIEALEAKAADTSLQELRGKFDELAQQVRGPATWRDVLRAPPLPKDMVWQCPDCDHWCSLAENARSHGLASSHGVATASVRIRALNAKLDEKAALARITALEERVEELSRNAGEDFDRITALGDKVAALEHGSDGPGREQWGPQAVAREHIEEVTRLREEKEALQKTLDRYSQARARAEERLEAQQKFLLESCCGYDVDRLGKVIETLKSLPPDLVLPVGLSNPHSYRGYYEQLAFEPKENVSVEECLKVAKSCVDKTFTGYKGGDYMMTEDTSCWLCTYGSSGGVQLSAFLIRLLAGMNLAYGS